MPKYKPVMPLIVDPAGVNPSLHARPMPTTTDATRAYTAQATGGAPLVDFAGSSNPYVDYQSIDLLLSLQHPRSQGYDETCFFIMGQVKELLFKALHFELYNAQAQVRADEVGNALEILLRAKALCDYIGRSWDVLGETLVQLADAMSQYRWRHFVSVQRIIGLKPGTGGSAGVGWLQHITEHRFFPELWSIRTRF